METPPPVVLFVSKSQLERAWLEERLRQEGFDVRQLYAPEEADAYLREPGRRCIWLVEGEVLLADERWSRLIERTADVPLVAPSMNDASLRRAAALGSREIDPYDFPGIVRALHEATRALGRPRRAADLPPARVRHGHRLREGSG